MLDCCGVKKSWCHSLESCMIVIGQAVSHKTTSQRTPLLPFGNDHELIIQPKFKMDESFGEPMWLSWLKCPTWLQFRSWSQSCDIEPRIRLRSQCRVYLGLSPSTPPPAHSLFHSLSLNKQIKIPPPKKIDEVLTPTSFEMSLQFQLFYWWVSFM